MAQTVDQSFVESNFNGKAKIKNRAVVKDSQGRLVAMGRNMAYVISDQSGKELAVQKILYGAQLHVDDGQEVKRGVRLAQWDPYMRLILTEVDGVADFADLVEGLSMKEQTDEMQGTTNRVIMDWRAPARLGAEAGHRHQGVEGRQAGARLARRRCALSAARRCHPAGRAAC